MLSQTASRHGPLIVTSLGHFTNDGTVFLIPIIIDLIATIYGTSALLITVSLTLFYLSTAVTANIAGPTIDRHGAPAKGMLIGIFVLSSGLLLFSVAFDNFMIPVVLIAASVITGAGASFYHPAGSAILQSYYKGDRLGRYLGINGSFGSLGRALYPTLIVLVALAFSSHMISVIFFGTAGIVFSLLIYQGIRDFGVGEVNRKAAGSQEKNDNPGNAESAGKSAMTGSILFLTVISLIRNLAFTGIMAWIPEFISFVRGVGSGPELETTMTIMFVGGIIGQLVFGKLVETYDKRLILTVSTISSAILLFLYIDLSGILSLASLLFFGFFNFSGFPIFMSMISDYVPRGSSTSSNALVWNIGGTGGRTVGPLVVGALIGGVYSHLPLAFEILLVVGVASAIMALVLPKPERVSKASVFGG